MRYLKIKKLVSTAMIPKYQTELASGMDLHALEDDLILPRMNKLIPTGIAIELPKGFEGQIRPRSGLAYKNMVTVLNAPGSIDQDYKGELKVNLINHSFDPFYIRAGDRIAQLVISPVQICIIKEVDTLQETNRNINGHGSTGV